MGIIRYSRDGNCFQSVRLVSIDAAAAFFKDHIGKLLFLDGSDFLAYRGPVKNNVNVGSIVRLKKGSVMVPIKVEGRRLVFLGNGELCSTTELYFAHFYIFSEGCIIKEAMELVETYGMPVHMSLDHDLGEDDTSMTFLRWLADENPPTAINSRKFHDVVPSYVVHSANPVGTQNIISFMNSWKKS